MNVEEISAVLVGTCLPHQKIGIAIYRQPIGATVCHSLPRANPLRVFASSRETSKVQYCTNALSQL
jgi:hypothetical protein